MRLFINECKKILLSLPYVILVITLFVFIYSQGVLDFSGQELKEPQPGQADYGLAAKEIPEVIMPKAVASLCGDYLANSYTAYPIGFYKNVKLNAEEQEKIADILCDLTGISKAGLPKPSDAEAREEQNIDVGNGKEFEIDSNIHKSQDGKLEVILPEKEAQDKMNFDLLPKAGLSYEHFCRLMEEVDEIIGGGSSYARTKLAKAFGEVPLTYEEALAEYNLMKETGFTDNYARLFSDYMGIMLGLLPVFIAVALGMKDRLAKMNHLIYTRKTASFHIIMIRYLAILFMVMVPVVISSIISNSSIWGFYAGGSLDYIAWLKYAIGWLLPSVMISTAVGMFITELTDTPIAIAVQGLWWFIDLNMGVTEMIGAFDLFRLAPRHNSLLYMQVFENSFHSLVINRVFFAGISILIVMLTVLVYEQKRKGSYYGYEYFKALLRNRKSQPAA